MDEFAGRTLVSETGEQDLRLQRVDVLADAGTVTSADADALREEILGATGSSESVTEGGCSNPSVCVSGTVLWTDSAGGTHPVDRSPVQILDQEAGADQVVTTVTTNGSGFFTATIDNNDGDATGRDVYVRVLADGPAFTLDQHIDSAVTVDVANGSSLTKNLTANNVADNNTAFSVHAALVYASDFIALQNGGPLPTVPAVFPSDGSYYDGTSFNLLALDRWDWDVALHEFGHHVADELNIESNPGGPHSGSQNLSDARKLRGASGQALPSTPPTLTWKRGNGGTHANNRFSVKFRDGDGAVLFTTVARNTTSYRPGAARWASIVEQSGGFVAVTVVGKQTDGPATGPYRSCRRSFGAL